MIRYCGLRRVSQVPCGEEGWARPAGWLNLPMPTSGSQEFYGLYGVFEAGTNYIALTVDGTEDYRVDWGDGTVDVVPAGTKAQHQYDFTQIPEYTYYSKGGYRQVIVHVTMLNGGNMTSFSLDDMHDDVLFSPSFWLDFNLMGKFLTSIEISPDWENALVMLERAGIFEIESVTTIPTTEGSFWFNYCYNLQRLELTGTQNVETINMFIGDYCFALKELPIFDTSSLTTVTGFIDYQALDQWPLLDFSNVTTFSGRYGYQELFGKIPAWDLSSVTSSGDDYINFYYFTELNVVGLRIGFTVTGGDTNLFNKAAIVKLFNNLGTAIDESQVITLWAYDAASDLTPAELQIATDKGFTVLIAP